MSGEFITPNPDAHARLLTEALAHIPRGSFILTSSFEDSRTGMLITQVQQCASNPPLVLFSVDKGQPIEPLIRDSRCFALCRIDQSDLLLHRIFNPAPDHGLDPFMALPTFTAATGSPILQRALAWIDCQVIRHVDVETNASIYIGSVVAAGARTPATKVPRRSSRAQERPGEGRLNPLNGNGDHANGHSQLAPRNGNSASRRRG